MRSIQEVSQETLKIENYLRSKKYGDYISYKDIESNTNVTMNNRGKSFLRTALKRLKYEYLCIRGEGIEIASVDSTMKVMTHKLVKVDNAVKRAEKTHNNLSVFYTELSIEDQKRINFVGAAFGAIRLAAQNGKRMLKENAFKPESKEFVKIN